MKRNNIPNMLSLLRIAMVPVYIASLYIVGGDAGQRLALIVFILAGITDYLDGYLARKLNCVSNFGKIIDPLADKLIVSVALISLAFPPIKLISIILVIIIIFREIMVTLLRKYFSGKNVYISANYWGKIKTFLQMTGIIGALIFSAFKEYFLYFGVDIAKTVFVIKIFFWVVVVVTIVSGISYLVPFARQKSSN